MLNEYTVTKLIVSTHYSTLDNIAEFVEAFVLGLASNNNQEMVHYWINLVCTTCEEKVGVLETLCCAPQLEAPAAAPPTGGAVSRCSSGQFHPKL